MDENLLEISRINGRAYSSIFSCLWGQEMRARLHQQSHLSLLKQVEIWRLHLSLFHIEYWGSVVSQIFLPLHDQKKNTFATVDLYVSVFSCQSFQVLIFQWKIQLNGLLPCLTTDTLLEFPPRTLKNLVKSSSLVSLAQYYFFPVLITTEMARPSGSI